MAACETADLKWAETSITELVISRAAAAVVVVPFTQRAEKLSGADWIWWWIDHRGAYGMLVQAKRLTVTHGAWRFGFDYPGGKGSQRATLMSTSRYLGLLPAYALYLGTGGYRGWKRCSDDHRSGRCLHCVKRSVSLMPALLAEESLVNSSAITYERSVALEELWTPAATRAMLIPSLRRQMEPELAEFLSKPQQGTRAVTRSMIDRVLRVRLGQLSTAPMTALNTATEGDHDRLGSRFADVPSDFGHWDLNYFQHVLDPLRQAPPEYALRIATGEFEREDIASIMPETVAGIVVVQRFGNAKRRR